MEGVRLAKVGEMEEIRGIVVGKVRGNKEGNSRENKGGEIRESEV